MRQVDEPPAPRGKGRSCDAGNADAAERERSATRDERVARLSLVGAGRLRLLAKIDRSGQRRARLKIDVLDSGIELSRDRRERRALGLLVMDAAHNDIDELLVAGKARLERLGLVLDLVQVGRLVHMLV